MPRTTLRPKSKLNLPKRLYKPIPPKEYFTEVEAVAVVANTDTWPRETSAEKFNRLQCSWRREAGRSSKLQEIVSTKSYRHIVGMGSLAVPFIFRELRNSPN